MLRASSNLSKRLSSLEGRFANSGLVSVRAASSQGDAAAKAQGETSKEPPPPPPPPPQQGGGWFWKLVSLTVVGGGGVVGYAWYDKNFKESVEQNVPYSKQAFEYVFQYLPSTSESSNQVVPAKSSPELKPIDIEEYKKMSLQRKKEPLPLPEPEKPAKKEAQPEKQTKPTKAEIEAKKKEEEKKRAEEKKQREKEEARRKLEEQEMEEAAENAALENILQLSLSEAEEAVRAAIDLQKSAAEATRAHTARLREAMNKQSEDIEGQWEAATKAFADKSDLLARAEVATEDARQDMERVRSALSEGKANKVTKKNKSIRSTEQTLNSLNYDLKTALSSNAKAQSEAKVMAEYRDLVKKGKEQFRKEIESITPDIKISKTGGRLSEEELNALIAHAHRRIEQLQKQLAEQHALEQLRIEAALQRQQQEDEKLGDARVEQERERMKADFSVQKDKWDLDARVNLEVELRRELARQAAAHSDHLAQVLRVQENDLKVKFDFVLNEKLTEERDQFQKEVAGWVARLKGIEAAVEGRAEMEQQGRKAQELWLACQMLHNVIQPKETSESGSLAEDTFDDSVPYEKVMKPLLDEFMAVLDAGNNHPFVNSVLETISDEAVKRGVWTERALVERFPRVRHACKRTAMIDETGGTLFQYIISHVQSYFVFSTSKPLAETDKVDPSTLSNFVLLDNAAHYLREGDLEQALRFMNQLRGESRRQAADWIKEARLLLETRQAADALLAHASANGLGALF